MEGIELISTPRFKAEVIVRDRILVVRSEGVLDEDVNLSSLLDYINSRVSSLDTVEFDMGRLDGMNSCGVREWLLFIERLEPSIRRVFTDVSEQFIEQANMISNLFGKNFTVANFQAPYHCPKCHVDMKILLIPEQVKVHRGVPLAPEFVCRNCSIMLQFDSIEEEYFEFIRRSRARAVA